MNSKLMIAAIGAGLMLAPAAPAALAQDAGPGTPGAVPPTEAPPAATPPAATPPAATPAADVTDADIAKFVRADAKVAQIQADDGVAADAKQGKMLEAVQAEGLTPQQYNSIAQAAQSDPALQQKIQQARPATPQPQ